MDTVDKATRSKIMSSVGQKNTGPEIKLRKNLHRLGIRYRLNDRKMPGSPDIVFPRYHTVLFVHGCFWHRHGCNASTMPVTNKEYWTTKFTENIERDKRNTGILIENGWRVIVVWECVLKGKKSNPESVAIEICDWLKTDDSYHEFPQ